MYCAIGLGWLLSVTLIVLVGDCSGWCFVVGGVLFLFSAGS